MRGIFLALITGLAAAQSERLYSQSSYIREKYQQGRSQPQNDAQQDTYIQRETEVSSRVLSVRSMHRSSQSVQSSINNAMPLPPIPPAQPDSVISFSYPAKPVNTGQPLLQAYPPHGTAVSNRNPVWDSTTTTSPYQTNRRQGAAASTFQNLQSVPVNTKNFNTELFQSIARVHRDYNVVYSPISLQLLLAFLAIGADGSTYDQLKIALGLPRRLEADTYFGNLRQSLMQQPAAQLIMANKMYFSNRLRIHSSIHVRARYYGTEVEGIDFSSPPAAATSINYWVAQKTRNIIPELISPAQIDEQTQALLVGAIHFKAKWAKEFSTRDTEKQNFYMTPTHTVPVDMMYSDDTFRYGEFSELDAAGLELPYENSNISMMILLPNKRNGLAEMEERLRNTDLNSLLGRMRSETVTLRLPRFRVEFELDMRGALKELGIRDLFSDRADLKGFFKEQRVGVSQVQHKAFLDVNEAGSEAAAASFIKLIPLSLPNRIVEFTADHPFMFAIRSPQGVLFIGHVVNIQ